MIDYQNVNVGDILEIVGDGAPGFALIGDLVRVTHRATNGVTVENRDGATAEFYFNCGAARLKQTEWKDDFDHVHHTWINMNTKQQMNIDRYGDDLEQLADSQ